MSITRSSKEAQSRWLTTAPSAGAVRLVDDFSAPYVKFNGREPRTLEELAIARQELQHASRLREIKKMSAKLALLDAQLPALAEHGISLQRHQFYAWDEGKVLSIHAPFGGMASELADSDKLHATLLKIGFSEIERRDNFGRTDHVVLKHGRALLVRLEVSKTVATIDAGAAA